MDLSKSPIVSCSATATAVKNALADAVPDFRTVGPSLIAFFDRAQRDVGQHRGDDPAPRRAVVCAQDLILRQNANIQELPNNAGSGRRPGIRIFATLDADDVVDAKALIWWVRLASSPNTIVAGGRSNDFFEAVGSAEVKIANTALLANESYQVQYKLIPIQIVRPAGALGLPALLRWATSSSTMPIWPLCRSTPRS
jgi:hypothetical protein